MLERCPNSNTLRERKLKIPLPKGPAPKYHRDKHFLDLTRVS